jgi:hypothetical protein
MTELAQDEAIRALMRRVFAEEVADSGVDVEAGLGDVRDRAAASTLAMAPRTEKVPVVVGTTGMPEAPPTEAARRRPPWASLTGRDRYAACMLAAREGDTLAFDALVADLSARVARGPRQRFGPDHGGGCGPDRVAGPAASCSPAHRAEGTGRLADHHHSS